MKIYIRHIRAAKYYRKEGVKLFFDAHDWDWSDFLANGIDAQKLIDTQDAMALNVIKIAQEEHNERWKKTDIRT